MALALGASPGGYKRLADYRQPVASRRRGRPSTHALVKGAAGKTAAKTARWSVLEAVRPLLAAEPALAVEQLVARLRDQGPARASSK